MHVLLAGMLGLMPIPQPLPAGGAGVYKRALPSVVWIQSSRAGGLASGSGSLIDAGRKLVLTNYHVVEDNPKATVFFPEFRDGRAAAEKAFYRDRAERFGIAARVVVTDRARDLAILRLDRLPPGTKAIPLADASPEPGETVHSIGNAGRSGALWGYVRGTVRQVYRKKWQAKLGRRTQTFEATVVETDSPTNPGDSGGPLLNDAGKLVGVTQGGALDAQSVSFFIDVSEVRKVLDSPEVRAARRDSSVADVDAKPAKIEVDDAAGVLSKSAVGEANKLLAELARAGRPTRVETLKLAPEAIEKKLEGATSAERLKLFDEYAFGRLRETKTDGAIILICTKPATAVVVMTNRASRRYADGITRKAAGELLGKLKARDFDAGVIETLKLLRDAKPAPRADD